MFNETRDSNYDKSDLSLYGFNCRCHIMALLAYTLQVHVGKSPENYAWPAVTLKINRGHSIITLSKRSKLEETWMNNVACILLYCNQLWPWKLIWVSYSPNVPSVKKFIWSFWPLECSQGFAHTNADTCAHAPALQ